MEWLNSIGSEPADGYKYNTRAGMYRIELIMLSNKLKNENRIVRENSNSAHDPINVHSRRWNTHANNG